MTADAVRARELAARCRLLEAAGLPPPMAERQVFEEALARHGTVGAGVYEAFLAAHAPGRRRVHGVYYTPAEVVACQVAMVDTALRGLGAAFDDPRVLVVDPATGSGAYPKAILERAPGARLELFESQPGAAVVARAAGLDVRECDALDVIALPAAPIVVCLGNPPYRRRRRDGRLSAMGGGVHAKNLHNDYVYFWRWALEHVCEQRRGPAAISFVTPASYLRGPAFTGLRERLRRAFDELWIVDLEGDHLAARRTANVFAIRTPIAIATGVRYGDASSTRPAAVRYAKVDGDRAAKLRALERVARGDSGWDRVRGAWSAPLVARRPSAYDRWPKLTDLFPWQLSGVQLKRTWPIAPVPEVLLARWQALLGTPSAADREAAFRATRDRSIQSSPVDLRDASLRLLPIAGLAATEPPLPPERYAYRSFDRHWVLPDARLGDFMRPVLWRAAGPRQVFLTSMLTNVLGHGPAVVGTRLVPDLDCYRGSFGARAVIPLWCDAAATRPNVAPGLLASLAERYGPVTPEALVAYCYAMLGTRGYARTFEEQLRVPGPRLPFPVDASLFWQAVALGQQLLDVHTYHRIAAGAAREVAPIGDRMPGSFAYRPDTQTLCVGDGAISPVARDTWDYHVSGLHVMRSWLRRRIVPRRGHSTLDALTLTRWSGTLTRELLELVWLLDTTLRLEPALDAVLARIVSSASRGDPRWPTLSQPLEES